MPVGFSSTEGIFKKQLSLIWSFVSLSFACLISWFSFLLLVNGGDEEDVSLLLHILCMIITYNNAQNIVKNLCDLGKYGTTGLCYGWLDSYESIEILAWV